MSLQIWLSCLAVVGAERQHNQSVIAAKLAAIVSLRPLCLVADAPVMHSCAGGGKAADLVSLGGGKLSALHRPQGVLLCLAPGSGAARAADSRRHAGRL